MSTIIEQEPLFTILPVGQEIIFTVSNNSIVATEKQVKFCCEVHISNDTMPNTAVSTHLIGIFKVTPNNAGVGIFDMRNIIENYVSADNRSSTDNSGTSGPQFKGTYVNENTFPLHIIDKFSMSTNISAFMVLQFFVEYLGAPNGGASDPNVVARADGTTVNSSEYNLFNGYVKHTDIIKIFNNNFGYDTTNFQPGATNRKFLTNIPLRTGLFAAPVVYTECFYNDYGTVTIYQPNSITADQVYAFIINYYDSDGTFLDTVTVSKAVLNGAYSVGQWTEDTKKQVVYFGCFPGNLQNWSAGSNIPTASQLEGGYILVSAINVGNFATMRPLFIKVKCPELIKYEPIRLCWLNQWGGWDYWTFSLKSVRSFKGKQTTYRQLEGSWNKSLYTVDSHRGGKKTFRVNSREEIRINTDYLTEDFNVLFEELINSPEIYILEGYQTDQNFSMLNNYVTPVTLKSQSMTRKTKVNDKLIQYTFTIEKTKTLRTQSI